MNKAKREVVSEDDKLAERINDGEILLMRDVKDKIWYSIQFDMYFLGNTPLLFSKKEIDEV